MMNNEQEIRGSFAVGVQSFEWIRERKAPYIDKTKYVWQMASSNTTSYFLSRPRRFGKSLLVDTLRCYFEGRKELFEGLYIYDRETEWRKHPVIRLNLNNGKYYEKDVVHGTLNAILSQEEKRFGITNPDDPTNYDARLTNMIHAAYEQTGEKVVILVDEYDAPMLDSINDIELQDYIRQRLRNLFSPLKAQEQYLRFVFLTGISKFSQLSVFSELNNLKQITFDSDYEAICGITEEELLTEWKEYIELLAKSLDDIYKDWGVRYSFDDTVAKLKEMYDGYHFSNRMTDIYCPWSLIKAFSLGDIQNFWFATGTPTMLIELMKRHRASMQQFEGISVKMEVFDAPTERINDPIPVLFQSGYLTLKKYNPITRKYTLGFPNGEVREGFANSLYKYYMESYVGSDIALGNAFQNLCSKEITIEEFVECLRTWYAGIPYAITDKNQNEQLYQSLIYAALVGFGADVEAESMTSDGRMDIALKLTDTIYIIELKYGKNADEAIDQILKKDYGTRFAADNRPVMAVGLNISNDRRTIDDWKITKL
ncbi:MAG: AAA family ATPase [Bacteroidales bacterium]|nr:AAA family ATPase [Bacteroidales bacterium]